MSGPTLRQYVANALDFAAQNYARAGFDPRADDIDYVISDTERRFIEDDLPKIAKEEPT